MIKKIVILFLLSNTTVLINGMQNSTIDDLSISSQIYLFEKIVQTRSIYDRIGFIQEYSPGLLLYGTTLGDGTIQEKKDNQIHERTMNYNEFKKTKEKYEHTISGILSPWCLEKATPLISLDSKLDLTSITTQARPFLITCHWLLIKNPVITTILSFHKTKEGLLWCGHNNGLISLWRQKET